VRVAVLGGAGFMGSNFAWLSWLGRWRRLCLGALAGYERVNASEGVDGVEEVC
jgi:hypothetical protein